MSKSQKNIIWTKFTCDWLDIKFTPAEIKTATPEK